MKLNTYEFPQSSFLGMPKDAAIIMNKILGNQNILKLLTYNTRDWENQPVINNEQVTKMLDDQQISLVPKIPVEKKFKSYIRMSYGATTPNATNPQYRDNVIGIDIVCHLDYWNLGNYELRPYRIAGEIDSMLDKARLSGIGILEFVSASPALYNDEFAGISLTYLAVRGHEDEINPLS